MQEDEMPEFLQNVIKDLEITDMQEDEAECVAYAWLLKTKLYMMGECNMTISKKAKKVIEHQVEGILEMLEYEG